MVDSSCLVKAVLEGDGKGRLCLFFFLFFLSCQGPWEPLDDLNGDLKQRFTVTPLLGYDSPAPFLGSEICRALGGT